MGLYFIKEDNMRILYYVVIWMIAGMVLTAVTGFIFGLMMRIAAKKEEISDEKLQEDMEQIFDSAFDSYGKLTPSNRIKEIAFTIVLWPVYIGQFIYELIKEYRKQKK